MLVAVTVDSLWVPSIGAAYKKWEHVKKKLEHICKCIFHDFLHTKKVKSAIFSHARNILSSFTIHFPILHLAETPRRSIVEMTWSTSAGTYFMIFSIEN